MIRLPGLSYLLLTELILTSWLTWSSVKSSFCFCGITYSMCNRTIVNFTYTKKVRQFNDCTKYASYRIFRLFYFNFYLLYSWNIKRNKIILEEGRRGKREMPIQVVREFEPPILASKHNNLIRLGTTGLGDNSISKFKQNIYIDCCQWKICALTQ